MPMAAPSARVTAEAATSRSAVRPPGEIEMRHPFRSCGILACLVGTFGIISPIQSFAFAVPPPVVEPARQPLVTASEEPGDLGITCSELSPERVEQLKV